MFRLYFNGPDDDLIVNAGALAPTVHEDERGKPAKTQPEIEPIDELYTTTSGRLIRFGYAKDGVQSYALVTAEEGAELVAQSPYFAWPIGGAPPAPAEEPTPKKRGKAAEKED